MIHSGNRVKLEENKERAYDYAAYLLGLRLRTEGEVREKMKQKGYSPKTIDWVIQQLLAKKYIDDQGYAYVYLDNLKKYKNFGYYGIKKKLMEKRLPSEIMERVLADGLPIEEEMKIALRILKKQGVPAKFVPDDQEPNQYQTFDEQAGKDRQKLVQKLRTKGFRSEVLAKLLF